MLELSNVKRAPKIDFSTRRHNSQHRKRERAVRVAGNQERDALGEPIERAERGGMRGGSIQSHVDTRGCTPGLACARCAPIFFPLEGPFGRTVVVEAVDVTAMVK
jgi:hypothetical protein